MNKTIDIIVVDDEMEALSSFLDKIIDKKEIRYHFFKDRPIEAIQYAKENPVDAAFLDSRMPGISGPELAKALIRENKDIKIVFI